MALRLSPVIAFYHVEIGGWPTKAITAAACDRLHQRRAQPTTLGMATDSSYPKPPGQLEPLSSSPSTQSPS